MENVANQLIQRQHYAESHALEIAEAGGKCRYCDEQLINSRVGYSSFEIDHLLPLSKYARFIHDRRNHVFCCRSCNSMKREFDPLPDKADPEDFLATLRAELIARVRQELAPLIELREKTYEEFRVILGIERLGTQPLTPADVHAAASRRHERG